MAHPIIQRELLGTLRTRRATLLLVGVAVLLSTLIVSRWPGNATVELSGAQAQEVLRLFAYGLLAVVVLLVPSFPASSIVRERNRGTLTLLLNSPMSTLSIYLGKACGALGFVLLLLAVSLPAASAAYAMGGISGWKQLIPLYGILGLVLLQYTALALLVSSYVHSIDAAIRITYALVLFLVVGTLGPFYVLQGNHGPYSQAAEWIRCASPIPAVMELVGHGDMGSIDTSIAARTIPRFLLITVVSTLLFAAVTVFRLSSFLLDRPKPQGLVTDERSLAARFFRRLVFLVDPQRRKGRIGFLVNPVMVKEFRTRRFGRMHWLMRLVAFAAVLSLLLAYLSTTATINKGLETISGILIVMQVAMIVVITPSLGASLISAERESGGWNLLLMTPLSARAILTGKLMSVVWTLVLLLFATLPGYVVMIFIHPPLRWQVWHVLICLSWLAAVAVLLPAAISSLCRRAATATTISYLVLSAMCVGTLLLWLGRGTSFSQGTVEAILKWNPLAAALTIVKAPGFADYHLVPDNWWRMGALCGVCIVVLFVQTWRLTRPQ